MGLRLWHGFVVAREHLWLAIIVFAAFGAVALGVSGFLNEGESWLRSFNDTIALFFVDFNADESNDQVQVARVFALLTVVLAGGRAIFLLFRSRVDAVRAHLSRSHVIVCGLGRRGTRLVQAFSDKGYRVVAIERDSLASAIPAARKRGALVVTGDATSRLVLERAGVAHAQSVIAVGPDDATNIEVAAQIINITETDPRVGKRRAPRIVVQVENEELVGALRESASDAHPEHPLELVNVFKTGAWSLLDHPTPFGTDEEPAPNLLVVGLGQMGGALVVASALLWQKLSGDSRGPLCLTVVDREASMRMAHLKLRYPKLSECNVTPMDLEPDTAAFEEEAFLERAGRTLTRVYVCLDNHVQGLSTGLGLLRQAQRSPVPVVVQVPSEDESAGRFLKTGAPFSKVGLHLFGLIEQMCTAELLLETPVETVARLQQRDYLRERLAAGKRCGETSFLRSWEDLSDEQREENRDWARSVPSKLAAIGAERRELSDWDLPLFEFSDEEIERLAELEHERWECWRSREGWRYAPERDEDRKLHPDVVSWIDLREESKDVDRNQIRNLPRQLARAGYEIVRSTPGSRTAAASDAAALEK